MPQLPTNEAELLALVKKMITGYSKKKSDFPRADVKKLKAEVSAFLSAKDVQAAAKAEMLRTNKEKARKLETLKQTINEHLVNSKFDTGNDPEKLRAIGWPVGRKRRRGQPPAAPRNIELVGQKPGMIHLKWQFPAQQSGGKVRGFIVRRRELKDGEVSDWRPHVTVFTNQAKLEDEGKGRAFEYHVVATNESGESDPSNTVAVLV